MKNFAIFSIAALISVGLGFISKSIADPELGISTVLLLWGMTIWYSVNRHNRTVG